MSEVAPKKNTMEYRFLGKSGMKVSNICLGTMTFGHNRPPPSNSCDEDLSHQIMDRYVELGGNFLDTANIYNNGVSEEIIGRWLERRERENIVLATKARFPMGRDKNNVGLSRRHITDSIDKSLKRLHTDYVDLFQIHCWDEATPVEETLRTLDDLVRCGKVRYVGGSNLIGWQMQKVMDISQSLGLNPFVTLQQQYSLLSRWSELESFQVCKQEGLGVLPWSPLKGSQQYTMHDISNYQIDLTKLVQPPGKIPSGLLSGKFKRNAAPTEGRIAWVAQDEKTRNTQAGPAWTSLDSKTFDILEATEKVAQSKGKSTPQVALRWLLQKDVVSSVVIGATKLSQLEDNMQAASGWTLSPEEIQELDEASKIDLPYPYEMVFRLNEKRKNPFSISQHVSNL